MRGARELRELGLHEAHVERNPPSIRRLEGPELDGVDRGLYGEDAPGGEGLPLPVVLHLHGILHVVGDVVHPAEHVADRIHERLAGDVVGPLQAGETSRTDADPVALPGYDGTVGDPSHFARIDAGDRPLLAGLGRSLGEVHELLELRVPGKILVVDFKCHGCLLLKS